MIKMIWAQTKDGIIGKNGKLPWNIKKEMEHFKQTTINCDVVMGSATFKSMNRKPLPKRRNYVLTRNLEKYNNISFDNLEFIDSPNDLFLKYGKNKENVLFVIGGNTVYDLFFPYADEIIRTTIKGDFDGDTKITNFDYSQFEIINQKNEDDFIVEYLCRKRGQYGNK